MQRIGYRHQRTLARPADIRGVGFITGARARLRFLPAPPDTGLVFVRPDLPGRPRIAASPDRVTGTARRTTLGPADSGVTLVEHVLAALAGLRIDNCVIELDAAEPPGLDGSAAGFVAAIVEAGAVLQPARREVWAATEPVVATKDGATIALHPPVPGDGAALRVSYVLDYGPQAPIPRQAYTVALTPETFAREIASNRTFLLDYEAEALRAQGVGKHLTADQLLVFGPRGVIDNTLRTADEPARHKVLDVVGDLALCGFDIAGHVVAYRSGHALNVNLAKVLTTCAAGAATVLAAPRPPVLGRRRAA